QDLPGASRSSPRRPPTLSTPRCSRTAAPETLALLTTGSGADPPPPAQRVGPRPVPGPVSVPGRRSPVRKVPSPSAGETCARRIGGSAAAARQTARHRSCCGEVCGRCHGPRLTLATPQPNPPPQGGRGQNRRPATTGLVRASLTPPATPTPARAAPPSSGP